MLWGFSWNFLSNRCRYAVYSAHIKHRKRWLVYSAANLTLSLTRYSNWWNGQHCNYGRSLQQRVEAASTVSCEARRQTNAPTKTIGDGKKNDWAWYESLNISVPSRRSFKFSAQSWTEKETSLEILFSWGDPKALRLTNVEIGFCITALGNNLWWWRQGWRAQYFCGRERS